jgi:hypothetical protein
MSGESSDHAALVQRLIAVIGIEYGASGRLFILADHRSHGSDRPPQIGGFTPDLFAAEIPETFHVLGEAKTKDDLESDRSARQVAAFLDHLSLRPSSCLYLAVPWFCVPRAQAIVRAARLRRGNPVQVRIITDLSRGFSIAQTAQ